MVTIQDVFNEHYTRYREVYTPTSQQAKAALEIMRCRTSALGGHTDQCDSCGTLLVHYNSCRNRHCPMCQGIKNAVWVDARSKDLLDAPYFHVVFTMPPALHALLYQNQERLYPLMYKCVAETLQQLAKDSKHIGAQIGFFSLLHTWGQDMHYHPHIHVVVLGGGLTEKSQWRQSRKKFFIPIKKLSKVFRGKFMEGLDKLYQQNVLAFHGSIASNKDTAGFQQLKNACYEKSWYTYSKRTFSSPIAVLNYLGNYTRRVAISNSRIVSMDEKTVTLRYKDYKDGNKEKYVTMSAIEFIRRFLMHILPKGFVKIRHYGLLANRNKTTKLALCRKLTNSTEYKPVYEGLSTLEIVGQILGRDVSLCRLCKTGQMQLVGPPPNS